MKHPLCLMFQGSEILSSPSPGGAGTVDVVAKDAKEGRFESGEIFAMARCIDLILREEEGFS